MSILSDEQIQYILNTGDFDAENPFILSHRAVAKAQDLHSRQELIKELEEYCENITHKIYFKNMVKVPRFSCPDCWAKFKKEIE